MSETADKIAKILEDPESIKMISEIAESFMQNSGGGDSSDKAGNDEKAEHESSGEKSTSSAQAASSELSSAAAMLVKKLSAYDVENTIRLIKALQPYLSDKRSSSADTVLSVLGGLKAVSNLNISALASVLGLLQ